MITENIRIPLEKYITGIVQKAKHKMLAIYCMPDHCHIFIGLNPKQSISDLTREIKSNSSKWINENKLTKAKFQWQNRFGAFSYTKELIPVVANYIQTQPQHHRKTTFQQEYFKFLRDHQIDFDSKYIFTELV